MRDKELIELTDSISVHKLRNFRLSIWRLLLIAILTATSTGAILSHANESASAESNQVTPAVHLDEQSNQSANKLTNESTKIDKPSEMVADDLPETKAQLYTILTSSEYANKKEVTRWKPKTKNKLDDTPKWLRWLLEHLFGMSRDSSNINLSIIAMILKGVAILLLILFIVWVVRNASRLRGWKNINVPHTKSHKNDDYEIIELSQNWSDLPAHEQIPHRVSQLLAQNNIAMATSVLYRGSLRWLSHYQQLTIDPATTEMQCLKQIEHIANHVLPDAQSQYLHQIIYLWIVIAYSKDQPQSNNQQKLQNMAQNWLQILPKLPKSTVTDSDNTQLHLTGNNNGTVGGRA